MLKSLARGGLFIGKGSDVHQWRARNRDSLVGSPGRGAEHTGRRKGYQNPLNIKEEIYNF